MICEKMVLGACMRQLASKPVTGEAQMRRIILLRIAKKWFSNLHVRNNLNVYDRQYNHCSGAPPKEISWTRVRCVASRPTSRSALPVLEMTFENHSSPRITQTTQNEIKVFLDQQRLSSPALNRG